MISMNIKIGPITPILALAAYLLLVLALPVRAESVKGGGDADIVQTLKKAQGMLRQLSQEKTELEAKLMGVEKELEDSKKLLDTKTKEAEAMANDIKQKEAVVLALQKNNEILKSNNEKIKQQYGAQLEQARNRINALDEQLQLTSRDNTLLVGAVKERAVWMEACAKNNKELVEVNATMLENFQNQGFWESVKNVEPLTGITTVAKESLAEKFRYKLDDLKVTQWQDPNSSKPAVDARK